MIGTSRAFMVVTMITASVVCWTASGAYAAGDEGVDRTVARALELFEQGRHADALRELDSARERVRADNTALAAKIDYNRACVLSAMKEEGRAQEILRGLDRSAGADRRVRGPARYNLGRLEAARAEGLSTTDPEAAIASLRAAERHFRNALADLPGDADTIRNIEVVQRRRAELQRAQDQQEQSQERKPDQSQKNDQPQAGEQPRDTEGQGERSPQGERPQNQQPPQREGQQPQESNRQQQGQQQGQAENQPESAEQAEQNQPQQGSQQRDGPNEHPRREGAEQQKQPSENEQAKPLPQHADESQAGENKPEQREFDVAAAQILDKERIRREQIRRMLQQMMRSRAAKVEKDW